LLLIFNQTTQNTPRYLRSTPIYLLGFFSSSQSKQDMRNEYVLPFARNHSRRTFLNLGRVMIRTRIIDIYSFHYSIVLQYIKVGDLVTIYASPCLIDDSRL